MPPPRPCANLGPQTQDRRLRIGIGLFAVTLALAVLLVRLDGHPALRWGLALPFFIATLHVAEAMYKTCPMLAARGLRESPDGRELVGDPEERARIRGNGKRVIASSIVLAVMAAGFFALLP